MISALIAQPSKRESKIKCPPPNRTVRQLVPRNAQTVGDSISDEERYVFKLIGWFFVLFVLPAILTLIYITLNPDAFMIDITPRIDFSIWQPGQRP